MPAPFRTRYAFSRVRNLERISSIAQVAVKHGFGYFFERHHLWGLVPGRRRVSPVPSDPGRRVRLMLEELGPTFVKFGQLLSTRPDLIPADIVEELVKLRDQVAPFPAEEASRVIQEQLGLSLERVFLEIDSQPIAAASIGQVYRAVLPGGRTVMVKVQRPEAAHQIKKDIELFYQIAGIIRDHLGEQLLIDPIGLVDEFAYMLNRELDYTLEARNAERMRKEFAHTESITVPAVEWRLTTSRVLIMDFLEGPTLNTLDMDTLSIRERRDLAETITGAWFEQVLGTGFFHGDPHPANIVYLGPRHIGLLDFGICGALTNQDLENGTKLFIQILDRQVHGVKKTMRRLGIRWSASKDDSMSAAVEDVFSRYYGASLTDIDPAQVLRDVFAMARAVEARMPSRFLLLEKTLVTLEGVVSEVYPEFNFFEAARPYARELVYRRTMPNAVAKRMQQNATAYLEALEDYPFQIKEILDQVSHGELGINFIHRGLDSFTHKLDILTNRLVVALVVVTLGLASSIIAVFVEGGPKLAGLSVWGIPGFLGALVFGAWLVWAIFRSGRL